MDHNSTQHRANFQKQFHFCLWAKNKTAQNFCASFSAIVIAISFAFVQIRAVEIVLDTVDKR